MRNDRDCCGTKRAICNAIVLCQMPDLQAVFADCGFVHSRFMQGGWQKLFKRGRTEIFSREGETGVVCPEGGLKGNHARIAAKELLEKLLNRFGQTISDLPKPQTADYAYEKCHIGKAYETATEWHGRLNSGSLDTGDYICHLADVIDRMEAALETAKLTMDCQLCQTPFNVCQLYCETHAKVTDWQLSGMDCPATLDNGSR